MEEEKPPKKKSVFWIILIVFVLIISILIVNHYTPPEEVCCKVYGYGEGMGEVNVIYNFTTKEECLVAEEGTKETVEDTFCTGYE